MEEKGRALNKKLLEKHIKDLEWEFVGKLLEESTLKEWETDWMIGLRQILREIGCVDRRCVEELE